MRKILIAAGTVLALSACGSTGDSGEAAAAPADGDTLTVVATTPEVADFTRVIGGGKVAVTQIMKPGVDPHDYEPTPADLQAISGAKVIVKNGVGLEEWLDPAIEAAGSSGTVVDSSTGVTLREGGHEHEGEEHEGEEQDPHIWHNPQNAKLMVATIAAALSKADPADAATYDANLTAYQKELDQLDADNEAAWARIPADQRKIVTNHDALGYYIERYDLEFVGSVIPSLDTSAELSAQQMTDLVARIKQTGTTAIFAESSLPPKTAEAIARQAGVEVIAGEDALYGDSLGPEGSPTGTYLGAEKHNTETLVAALGG